MTKIRGLGSVSRSMKPTVLFVLVALFALGCDDREAPASASVAAPEAAPGIAEDGKSRAPQAPPERKLVQNAELRVEVGNYGGARTAVDSALASVGGYV